MPEQTKQKDPLIWNWKRIFGLEVVYKFLAPIAADFLQGIPRYQPPLIVGPTGIGKNPLMELIVIAAKMKKEDCGHINCAAFSGELVDAELYGYEEGAFTGAHAKGKYGLISPDDIKKRNNKNNEQPRKQIIVLDEIGSMEKSLQAKMLTFLDNGEFRRVGGTEVLKSSQKVIGMTNTMDYPQCLREDFRFRFFEVLIPGLNEIRHEIPILLHQFAPDVPWTHLDMLRSVTYNWPGNIRELRRFADLSQQHHEEINNSGLGVIEWFYDQYRRYGGATQHIVPSNVPPLGRYEAFLEYNEYEEPLVKRIDKAVPLFPLSKRLLLSRVDDKILKPTLSLRKKKWLEQWHTWCHIFNQDYLSKDDIWEEFLSGKGIHRPWEDDGPPERARGKEIDKLSDDVNEWLGGNHGQTESAECDDDDTDFDIKPKKDPLKEILHKYNPYQYEELWVQYCQETFSSSDKAAKHYNIKRSCVKGKYYRKKKRIEKALTDRGEVSALNLDAKSKNELNQ